MPPPFKEQPDQHLLVILVPLPSSKRQPIALCGAKVFTGNGMADNHAVVVAGRRIQAVVPFDELDSSIGRIDLTGLLLAPGFLDLQVNGGGGQLFSNSPDTDTLRLICRAHRKSGTAALLPTLISGNVNAMQTAIAAVHSAMESQIPGVVGIHL